MSHKTGLSLSGGGYRATAFHLGTLKKLHAFGILEQVDIISTISGGSITGAYYALHHDNFDQFAEILYKKLQTDDVIKKVLLSATFMQLVLFVLLFLIPATYVLFTPYAWLSPIIMVVFILLLLKFQFNIFPVSRRIEKLYNKYFYDNKTLGALPERPILVIGSTNLQTARAFTFSRTWMQDTTYQYAQPKITFRAKEFPIARAVMASSCVPFAFTPVKIEKQYYTNPEQSEKIHPVLVDGGVYDNQGIHKIMVKGQYACDTVITSDAGGAATGEQTFRNTIALLSTTVEVFMSRIKKAQMVQDVYGNVGGANKQIAYLSLGWDVENCIPGFIDNLEKKQITQTVIEAHQLLPEWIANPEKYREAIRQHLEQRMNYENIIKPTPEEKKIARKVGTNLTALRKQQVDCLIKQAEALTELQVKLYCPSLLINKDG